ncbi:MAG: T9SS type A sorting domain-containing protein [Saprospiraceae bacterium]|nr:T9SS type A sorting domain-containing protein [Saprospiraceae bacterium]
MHKPYLLIRMLSLVLPCLLIMAGSMSVNAQRSSEKYATIITGQATVVDQIVDPNLVGNPSVISQVGSDFTIVISPTTKEISIGLGSTSHGYRSFTIEYIIANPTPKSNYRVYHLNFVTSSVKANDDLVIWDGTGALSISPLDNDEYTGPVTIQLNQNDGNASVLNNVINYTNTNFSGSSYIQYTVTDSLGTADQAIIKIEEAAEQPSEDQTFDFVVNYQETKNITVPEGFTLDQFAFNGEVESIDATHFVYTPEEYFIGQDSFSFVHANGTVLDYHARVIDAERDPGFVRNDVVYTPKNTPITFDVFANDLVKSFPIVEFSPQLVHDTLGVFTYTPATNFSGTKSFTYKVDSGVSVETGKITLVVGNHNPQADIIYQYEIPGNKTFVIEYDVPIDGYSFTIDPNKGPTQGVAYAFQDSTSGLSCGTAYGKALIAYTPDPNFVGGDTMEIKYCVANNPVCVTYKLYFNVIAPTNATCPCIDDCVWSGDLNGDGRVSAHDLLTLGRFLGYEGPARDTSNTYTWGANEAADWGVKLPNGKDLKHADANGDGRLTADDMQGILDNFNKISSLVPNENLGYKDFPFTLSSNYSEVEPGDTLVINFHLGSATLPANDIHGISFALNIDGDFVDSSSLRVKFFDNTWMADHSPTLQMHKQVSDGNVRLAFTRSSGQGASGNGIIGQATWIVGEEDAEGVRNGDHFLQRNISVENILIENVNGDIHNLRSKSLDVKQLLESQHIYNNNVAHIDVYPNPVNSDLKIDSKESITSIQLFDSFGSLLKTYESPSNNTSLDVSNLMPGVYVLLVAQTTAHKYLRFVKL